MNEENIEINKMVKNSNEKVETKCKAQVDDSSQSSNNEGKISKNGDKELVHASLTEIDDSPKKERNITTT